MKKFDISKVKNPESIKIFTFKSGEFSGILAIHTLDIDSMGFYRVKTVIETPHGQFYQESRLNPVMLADDKDLAVKVLFQDCIERYEKAIA